MSTSPADEVSLGSLFLIALVANLGSLLFGYDFGATSWLLVSISNYATSTADSSISGTNYYVMVTESSGLTGLVAAGASIGATLTYIVLLFAGNSILKKDEILLSAMLFFTGALLESTSGSTGVGWTDGNYDGLVILVFGRLVYGAGIATSFHSVPQYVSEMGPKDMRGMIGSLTEAMIVTGVVLGFLLGYLYEDGGWVVPFRVGYCIAVVMGILALFIPHSPSGMINAGYSNADVLESYRVIHPKATEADVHLLQAKAEEEKAEYKRWEKRMHLTRGIATDMDEGASTPTAVSPSCFSLEVQVLLSDSRMRRCLFLALLLVLLQIGTGQGVILFYSGDIFTELCPNTYDECILAFGGIKLTSAYLMVGFADCLGRRDFLVWGTAAMVGGMVMLITAYAYRKLDVALLGLFFAVAGYEAGLGSFLWILLSEIFPRFTRSASNSISVAVLFLFSTILTFTLPYFLAAAGLTGILIFFTVIGALAVVALYLYVPETRGVELELAYKDVDVRCRQSGASLCCVGDDADEDGDDDVNLKENTDEQHAPLLPKKTLRAS